jgi:hypothetical protein
LEGQVDLASAFRVMEEHKNEVGILDYSISQTRLEQVFVAFAEESQLIDTHGMSKAHTFFFMFVSYS